MFVHIFITLVSLNVLSGALRRQGYYIFLTNIAKPRPPGVIISICLRPCKLLTIFTMSLVPFLKFARLPDLFLSRLLAGELADLFPELDDLYWAIRPIVNPAHYEVALGWIMSMLLKSG